MSPKDTFTPRPGEPILTLTIDEGSAMYDQPEAAHLAGEVLKLIRSGRETGIAMPSEDGEGS